MQDWNVIVTLYEEMGAYRRARGLLGRHGDVAATDFHNSLVMRVDNVEGFWRDFAAMCEARRSILDDISHAVPLSDIFAFTTPDDFEQKARRIALSWTDRLRGGSFHARLRRRGFKGVITSPEEERFLDEVLLDALEKAGAPGRIRFEDPDFVIDIETVGERVIHRRGVYGP